jgi:4-hydroxy-3-methylbut-2-enyl diphosphate reductase IspH
MGMVMNEMTSAQVYRARQVVIARAAEENKRLYDVMVATKARQQRVAQAVKPVEQVSVVGRVKASLLSKNKKV